MRNLKALKTGVEFHQRLQNPFRLLQRFLQESVELSPLDLISVSHLGFLFSSWKINLDSQNSTGESLQEWIVKILPWLSDN